MIRLPLLDFGTQGTLKGATDHGRSQSTSFHPPDPTTLGSGLSSEDARYQKLTNKRQTCKWWTNATLYPRHIFSPQTNSEPLTSALKLE